MTTPVASTNAAKQEAVKEATKRLPCRGCTSECKNYGRCDGKPWRMGS